MDANCSESSGRSLNRRMSRQSSGASISNANIAAFWVEKWTDPTMLNRYPLNDRNNGQGTNGSQETSPENNNKQLPEGVQMGRPISSSAIFFFFSLSSI